MVKTKKKKSEMRVTREWFLEGLGLDLIFAGLSNLSAGLTGVFNL